jgi:hypothetical protein
MKDAFFAWGAGSRGCMGAEIAQLELMRATCMFFHTCAGARIMQTMTTPETIEYRDFFAIAPQWR